jgi:trimethylamine corrinoid protein
MLNQVLESFREAVCDTDQELALRVVHQAVENGMPAEEVVFRVVIPCIEEMMALGTHDPDANLAQHFMTAQICAEATERMLTLFKQPPEVVGGVIIGTARGDLHSLGKRIVIGCLRSQMVNVVDLGVNVPAERFVDEAVANDAQVIAVSSMMVHTASGENGAIRVRQLLKARGLEARIKLAVGGAPYRFDHGLYRTVGADAWAEDGLSAGRVILDLIKEVKGK